MGVEPKLVGRRERRVPPVVGIARCLALVVLATMVPLIYPPIPPLVDLFGHMGRYRVELDLAHSPWLQRYYDYHWAAIGNLGVDLLVIPFGKLLGLEAGSEADRDRDPAAHRCRFPLGSARSAWTYSADGFLRASIHLRLSFPVRVREFRIVGRPCLPGVRPVAEARPAGPHRRSRVAVRTDLARGLLLPHLRLGLARVDVLFGRRGEASRPRPDLVAGRDSKRRCAPR